VGVLGVRRAFVTASLPLVIARHERGEGTRDLFVVRALSGERCDPLARSGSGSGGETGVPAFGGATAGGDPGVRGAARGGECL
jgi:hypothetical protein